jgi:hypothetical protein
MSRGQSNKRLEGPRLRSHDGTLQQQARGAE